ncbi:MAG: penicillin-binding protein 1A [Pseudomonadota bacterium]
MIHPSTPDDFSPEKPRKVKRSRRRLVRILNWVFATMALGFIFTLIAVAAVVEHYSASLPSTDQLANYNPAVVTRLYAADGKLMAEYAKEKRFFLPLSAIPKNVQNAFLSAEDKNFYSHQGVDMLGTLRAIKENVLHIGKGHSLVGGSTITQQVVKNFLLTSEKSFERKIKEAILAYRISNIYSKEKILELYLNEIYLGQGTYGVAAASITYFDKSLDQLTTEEAAFLAALPKAPAYFDPTKNYKRAFDRRNYVISRMREDGYIDTKEELRAEALPITTRARDKGEVARADFFAEEVRRALAGMYGSNVLYEGGLFVKTTLNPKYQDYADRALRYALMTYDQRHGYRGPIATLKHEEGSLPAALERIRQEKAITLYDAQTLAVVDKVGTKLDVVALNGDRGSIAPEGMAWAKAKFTVGDVLLVEAIEGQKGSFKLLQIPAVNGALVVMDPHTGKVLAMSGGYAYGGSEFNRATQAKRQPGSAFKPFVYLTALESGFSPTSVILDGPISLPQGPGLPMWTPKNYEGDYMGPITFRTALEHSRNAVTVRIASMIGIKRIMRVAKRFGLYEDEGNPNYSMVLGAKETTLLKLVNGYSMIANGGRRVAPWFIERIDDRNGATIFRRDTRACESCTVPTATGTSTIPPTLTDERERVLDPRVAYQITSILEGVVQRGTGGAARVLGRPVAGKTGTTNDSRDTWFIGYTPDLVIGTYVGFDVPKSLGEKETGGRVAIQGFIKFMQQAGDSLPIKEFRAPPGIREIAINRSTGQPLYAADAGDTKSILKEAFLTGGPIFKPFNELQEELKDKSSAPVVTPEDLGADGATEGAQPFERPAAGEMAPYQRPVDPQGFDPNTNASTGTGGLY